MLILAWRIFVTFGTVASKSFSVSVSVDCDIGLVLIFVVFLCEERVQILSD